MIADYHLDMSLPPLYHAGKAVPWEPPESQHYRTAATDREADSVLFLVKLRPQHQLRSIVLLMPCFCHWRLENRPYQAQSCRQFSPLEFWQSVLQPVQK